MVLDRQWWWCGALIDCGDGDEGERGGGCQVFNKLLEPVFVGEGGRRAGRGRKGGGQVEGGMRAGRRRKAGRSTEGCRQVKGGREVARSREGGEQVEGG